MPKEDLNDAVSQQQVDQFLTENRINASWYGDVRGSLESVPADRWVRISTFVRNNSGYIDTRHITTLAQMSITMLDSVLAFCRKHQITSAEALHVLSQLTAADFKDFTTFIEENALLNQVKLLEILVKMPKENWHNFAHFIQNKNIEDKNIEAGLLYVKQPQERWDELLHVIQKKMMSDGVIEKLAKMSPDQAYAFIHFLQKNALSRANWNDIDALVEVPEVLRERVWAFAQQDYLMRLSLKEISEEQWDFVNNYITRFLEGSDNTAYEFSQMICSLAKMSSEEWVEFTQFISANQITDVWLIYEYAQIPANTRDNLLRFIEKYNPNPLSLHYLRTISAEMWPQFMTIIDKYHITHLGFIYELARTHAYAFEKKNASQLGFVEELASFIEQHHISDDSIVQSLVDVPKDNFYKLVAFVQKFNIQDPYIIKGLAMIPDEQQWEELVNLSSPFFQDPLPQKCYPMIMIAIYDIRIDMPIYGEEERQGRIRHALTEIQEGRMPQSPHEYDVRLCEILTTPLNQLDNMQRAAQTGATAINVHADGRDDATHNAIRLLMEQPYEGNNVQNDYEAFIGYINAFSQPLIKKSARKVLGLENAEGFGPISADSKISSFGIDVTGRQFFARLWYFINHGSFIGVVDKEQLNKERENARVALVTNLADAYEEEQVVCNPGKIQRIVVGVLQGRLQGVHVDKEIPVVPVTLTQATEIRPLAPKKEETIITNAVNASLRDFLKEFASAETQQELNTHVDEWLKKEQGLEGQQLEAYRNRFKCELKTYLELDKETVVSPAKDNFMGVDYSNISMMVLEGFIVIAGITAVAVAFTVLNAATFGTLGLVVAGFGVASILLGIGLFTTDTRKNAQTPPNIHDNHQSDVIGTKMNFFTRQVSPLTRGGLSNLCWYEDASTSVPPPKTP